VTVSPDGVWLIGDFTTPQWQDGALQLTDADADGVYSVSATVTGAAEIKYKFVNGLVTVPANEEIDIAACGCPNGIGGFNRSYTRTTSSEVLPGPCFNTCTVCFTGVEENAIVSNLQVFPVPAQDVLNVNFISTVAQRIAVKMVNNMGQVVISENLGTVSGQRTIRLNTQALSSGVYSLEIANGTAIQSVRVLVK